MFSLPLPSVTSLDRFRKIIAFLTPTISWLIVLRVVFGFAICISEFFFAHITLSFLQRTSDFGTSSNSFFRLLNGLSFSTFMALFLAVIIFRGGLEILDNLTGLQTPNLFQERQQRRLIDWLFQSRSVDAAEFTHRFEKNSYDASRALDAISQSTRNLAVAICLSVALLVMSPRVTIILFIGLGSLGIPLRRLSQRVTERGNQTYETVGKLTRILFTTVKNLLLVQIHGTAEETRRSLHDKLDGVAVGFRFLDRRLSILSGSTYVAAFVTVAIVGTLGKRLDPGIGANLIPYLYLMSRALNGILGAVNNLPRIRYFLPALNSLASWWAEHASDGIRGRDRYQNTREVPFERSDVPFGWNLRHVSFRYSENTSPVLENFNLDVPPGSALVLRGESGAGKSTVIGLMIGQLIPTEGRVEISSGTQSLSISRCRKQVLKRLGYVGAESFLVAGTVRQNLLYGQTKPVSDERIWAVLNQTKCQFVSSFPKGLEHLITDQGEGISAGQKQRLCLARALLRSPLVLILDEATANLDEDTEADLVEELIKLKGRITLIAATHRKGLARIGDQILSIPNNREILSQSA